MSNDYKSWKCPECTLNNSYSDKKCSACYFDINRIKKPNPIKSAIASFSNDVKGLLNGFNNVNNNTGNNETNRREINNNQHKIEPSPDVIEISPFSSNRRTKPANLQLSPIIDELWSCNSCSYSTNPSWSNECDICLTKREKNPNTSSTSTKPINKTDSSGLTLYDDSLNEKIYEYARIWACKMCTYVNFSKDLKCELCSTPRNQNDPGLTTQDVKPGWVCKQCTYFNLEKDSKCIVCFKNRLNSGNTKEKLGSKGNLTNGKLP